jgi:regulator of sigma E protease
MYLAVSIVAFVLMLFVLVGIHELGHFVSAKLCKIHVAEFGFGFPPRLWGRRYGETLFSLNAIPLGGFVRLEGENGEITGPRSFGARPAWQRLLVLAAGACMNLIGALVLFYLVFTIAPIPEDRPIVSIIEPQSPATQVLKLGDVVTAVNGVAVTSQDDVRNQVACTIGHPTTLTIRRHGATLERTVIPRVNPPAGQGRVGFAGRIVYSGTDGWQALQQTLAQPGDFVQSVAGIFQNHGCVDSGAGLTGPVGIARVTGAAANAVPQLGMGPVLYLAALISMNLAFVNLLPFPALDGGRMLVVLVGIARRRRVDPRREALFHALGFALLLTLVLGVSAHDISQWIAGQ